MDHFASQLSNVTCGNDLSLTFKDKASYEDAIDDWQWVNFDQNRTFIMVVNYGGCDEDESRQPWIISKVDYDAPDYSVHFTATKKEWEDLGNSMTIQWGKYAGGQSPQQKRGGHDLDHTFDLSHTLNANLYHTNISGLDFNVDCDGCGTKGSLEVSGDISTSWGIPDKVTLSAVPKDIEVDLGLKFGISGTLVKGYNPDEFNLATIGIPTFTILKILQVGPTFQIDAGLALSGIQGSASVSSGITGKIPNSATAEVNLFDEKDTKINGWTPTISTQPIVVDAEIDGTLEMYLRLSVDIGITVLGKGVGIGIGLKVPDVHMELGAEFNNQGVCPNHAEMFGVKFSGGIGVDLNVEAYTESGDKKTPKFTKDLYNNPNLYAFPNICLPFKDGPKAPISMSSTSVATTTAKPTTSDKPTSSSAKPTSVSASASGKPTGSASGTASTSSLKPIGTGTGGGKVNGTTTSLKPIGTGTGGGKVNGTVSVSSYKPIGTGTGGGKVNGTSSVTGSKIGTAPGSYPTGTPGNNATLSRTLGGYQTSVQAPATSSAAGGYGSQPVSSSIPGSQPSQGPGGYSAGSPGNTVTNTNTKTATGPAEYPTSIPSSGPSAASSADGVYGQPPTSSPASGPKPTSAPGSYPTYPVQNSTASSTSTSSTHKTTSSTLSTSLRSSATPYPTNGTATASATKTAGPSPAGPTATGQPANCDLWYTACETDTCSTLEKAQGISHADFLKWNPSVDANCSPATFKEDYAYCVGVKAASGYGAPASYGRFRRYGS
jgi:hypothetical protein